MADPTPNDDVTWLRPRDEGHTAPPIAPGTLLVNTYRIERAIGRGGMGEVWRARHVDLGTVHAIKVIAPEHAADPKITELFRREAGVIRSLRDEALVAYDGVFRDDAGRMVLVMEFVDGPSLKQRLLDRKLDVGEIQELRGRLARGLAAAHDRGVFHRDLSPDNIILPDGLIDQAKIIDFGIAKLTDMGGGATIVGDAFAGKIGFAAPEQLGLYGGNVDARTDLYALGLLLAAAARGRMPEGGQSLAKVASQRQRKPDLSDLPAGVREVIAPLLEPDPRKRPASALALLGGRPAGKNAIRPERHRGSGAAIALVFVLVLVAGAAGALAYRADWRAAALAEASSWRDTVVAWGGEGRDLVMSWIDPQAVEPPPPPVITPIDRDTVPDEPVVDTNDSTDTPPVPDGQDVVPPVIPDTEDTDIQVVTVPDEPDVPVALPAPDTVCVPSGGDIAAPPSSAEREANLRRIAGLPPDQIYAAAATYCGRGDPDAALVLLEIAAEHGIAPAAIVLGRFYDPAWQGRIASPFRNPNPDKARSWYERAAELGATEAQAALAALPAGTPQ